MAVTFFSEEVPFKIQKSNQLSSWIISVIRNEKKKCGDISIIFTSDENLLEINKKYLKHDYFTDVITFDYTKNDLVSGDIFISVDMIENNAIKFDVEFYTELYRIIIHGILHLLGYQDKEMKQKRKMTSKEDFYLEYLYKDEFFR